jgi:hypothetical protein
MFDARTIAAPVRHSVTREEVRAMSFRYCTSRWPFPAALLLVTALVFLGLGAVSCRQVTDPAQTLTISKGDVGHCIDECNDDARDATRGENELHKIRAFLCRKNPTCLASEDVRHQAALDRIEARRLACIQECHHQGGAHAGR